MYVLYAVVICLWKKFQKNLDRILKYYCMWISADKKKKKKIWCIIFHVQVPQIDNPLMRFQSRLRKIEYKPKSTHQLIDLQIINKHPSCYCICFSEKGWKYGKCIPVTHHRHVYNCDFTLHRRRRRLGINKNHQECEEKNVIYIEKLHLLPNLGVKNEFKLKL